MDTSNNNRSVFRRGIILKEGEEMIQPHILCEKVSERVLLPGDPKRVDRVAKFLENVKEVAFNREFKTIIGEYKGKKITVTSTGIGGTSAAIALEELIACGGSVFIRIGSAGAIQNNIDIGDLIISTGSIREDGASAMYVEKSFPAVAHPEVLRAMEDQAIKLDYKYHIGLTRSHDSFYVDDEMERMKLWHNRGVLGSDMETSALFVIGHLRNVRVGAVLNNVVVYEADVKDGINNYVDSESLAAQGEEKEIILALESLISL